MPDDPITKLEQVTSTAVADAIVLEDETGHRRIISRRLYETMSRVGVDFSDEQKALIRGLSNTNPSD